MLSLAHNSLFVIDQSAEDGLYRVIVLLNTRIVVAEKIDAQSKDDQPSARGNVLFPMDRLVAYEEQNSLRVVGLAEPGWTQRKSEELTEAQRALHARRIAIMSPFLDHAQLVAAFCTPKGFGRLVRETAKQFGCTAKHIYELWHLLCLYGFNTGSLIPRYDQSGAPGKARPISSTRKKAGRKTTAERIGLPVPHPQIGLTEDIRYRLIAYISAIKDPKLTTARKYRDAIKHLYVKEYVIGSGGKREPVMPPQGTYPNEAQVRHLIKTAIDPIKWAQSKTTSGHFARNCRGLKGYAWQSVPGPGHSYLIDSTVADIYLRSSINRAWFIGRPYVYFIIDLWSTAIVGFYVSLRPPSWEQAQLALFNAFSEPEFIAALNRANQTSGLYPNPGICYVLYSDRGEYLSQAAAATAKALNYNQLIAPPYRPDLKGLVEVFHRVTKDEQYLFVPGAIDRRRKELELQTKIHESAFVPSEYVTYLTDVVAKYNRSADRSDRLKDEMIAADCDPTPGGLWQFGHEAGLGYRLEQSQPRLIRELLPTQAGSINRKGFFLGNMHYELARGGTEDWTAMARNFGAQAIAPHIYPGETGRAWWFNTRNNALESLTLSSKARVRSGISFDEWLDACSYDALKTADRAHKRMTILLKDSVWQEDFIREAQEKNREAELIFEGKRPTTTEARAYELGQYDRGASESIMQDEPRPLNRQYEEVMNQLLAESMKQTARGHHA